MAHLVNMRVGLKVNILLPASKWMTARDLFTSTPVLWTL